MPSYILTFKPDTPNEEKEAAKKTITDQGGKIGHEYTLLGGFSFELPADAVSTLDSNPHVHSVEPDSEVKIQ
ncbi:hypothetical protein SEUCBS139899_000835 [Sporothrix eucalyptigena]|uniref:Inhibitor I9 domain-containing protein n=1 Tax=Sporothrix eucalyptigena TaxID=1812306 RepID=A0ABP0AVM6_9PEZI